MKNIIKLSLIFFAVVLVSSCEPVLIGEHEEDSPVNNFELFWNDINEGYGLFQARGTNWDSLYSIYRPQVTENTSFDELFDILSQMIEPLDDSHTALFERRTGKVFASGYTENKKAHEIMDRELVENNYLESIDVRGPENLYVQGKVKDMPVGYIYWRGVESYHDEFFEDAINDLSDMDALIIDVRSNRGGDGISGRAIANRFSDGEYFTHTTRNKIGPGPDDFAEKVEYHTSLRGDEQWTKPVILLTNRASISAAEDFLLNMKKFAHVTQIGDTTAGDFSDVSLHRFLPNGIEYKYSTQWYQLPDGSVIDGIGHIPDIEILNTLENVEDGIDAVMDKAFEFLKDEYGIE